MDKISNNFSEGQGDLINNDLSSWTFEDNVPTNFDKHVSNYLSIDNVVLINEYKIPEDRIDIIPEALNLYSLIIKELKADIIENSFWSISDGMVKKILKDQL